jgi:hypothetical protein
VTKLTKVSGKQMYFLYHEKVCFFSDLIFELKVDLNLT